MGGFVGGKAVQKFIGSPAMVDLVKHGPCHVGFHRGKHLLFVKKLRIGIGIDGKKDGAVGTLNHKFV